VFIDFIAGSGKPRVVVVHSTARIIGDGGWTYGTNHVNSSNIGSNYGMRVGMRVASHRVIAGQPNRYVWGKMTGLNFGPGGLTVDQWVGGTPTDGQTCYHDGWVIDLPYAGMKGQLVETFAPETLVHELAVNRKDTRFEGYNYDCKLSYEEYVEADTILLLRPALNAKRDDRLIFIPRSDRSGRNYNVWNAGGIKIARHSVRSHKYFSVTFRGKELVAFPIPNSGYGYGYAQNYGHQL
jgi:hypothetical protein